jgi:hypothetical protein
MTTIAMDLSARTTIPARKERRLQSHVLVAPWNGRPRGLLDRSLDAVLATN